MIKKSGVLVEGVAQLEFVNESDMRSASLQNFKMVVEVEMQEEEGCIGIIFNAMLSALKQVRLAHSYPTATMVIIRS